MSTMKSHLIWLSLLLHFSSSIHSLLLDESLDAILEEHALRVMMQQRPHTGALYSAPLPADLAGIKLSVVGLRTTTLWRKGANFSNFIIPPKTLPTPYVKRLLIVYHNLGNWSSLYYNLSGYSMISPVIGFLVYDASQLSNTNLSKLQLSTKGEEPISIGFQKSDLIGEGKQSMRRCAFFGDSGEVLISELSLPNVCYGTSRGHFSIVVPLEEKKKKKRMWPFWVVGGFVGLVLVGLGGIVAVRSLVWKRAREMERGADEGECLESYWIATSKLPRAEVTRTHPVLESTSLPNPKLSWYA